MNQPPPYSGYPPPHDPRKDDENLNLLSLFHYILAGIAALGIIFIIGHYLIMTTMMFSPQMWQDSSEAPPPELKGILRGFYFFSGAMVALVVGLNIAAARFLKQRKNRTFIMIVAGINCLNMPLGTALGVFTLILLMKPHISNRFVLPE